MSEEAEAIKKLVVTALEQDRHGVSLQGGLVKPLAAYLVGALKVERIPQDLPDTLEEWLKTANEAFEADGGRYRVRLRRASVAGSRAMVSGRPLERTCRSSLWAVSDPGCTATMILSPSS